MLNNLLLRQQRTESLLNVVAESNSCLIPDIIEFEKLVISVLVSPGIANVEIKTPLKGMISTSN